MKYSIAKGQQGEKVLQIDGFQSICPYTAPIPFQGNMGQVQIMRMPCSTLCPHAAIIKDGEFYSVNCAGGKTQEFPLEKPSEGENVSKIVSL